MEFLTVEKLREMKRNLTDEKYTDSFKLDNGLGIFVENFDNIQSSQYVENNVGMENIFVELNYVDEDNCYDTIDCSFTSLDDDDLKDSSCVSFINNLIKDILIKELRDELEERKQAKFGFYQIHNPKFMLEGQTREKSRLANEKRMREIRGKLGRLELW